MFELTFFVVFYALQVACDRCPSRDSITVISSLQLERNPSQPTKAFTNSWSNRWSTSIIFHDAIWLHKNEAYGPKASQSHSIFSILEETLKRVSIYCTVLPLPENSCRCAMLSLDARMKY